MADSIKVFIVDDSAVVRQVMTSILEGAQGISVIGVASDPIIAMKKFAEQWPDVILLDIEMPNMDGLTFLKKIMSERPTPVVICSTLTTKGSQITLDAVSSGAIEVITKPTVNLKGFLQSSNTALITAIKSAAQARMSKVKSGIVKGPILSSPSTISGTTDRVVAIGTSTGGTQALERILTRLPKTTCGIVVVQHMPEAFTSAFANRLNSICEMDVKEAADNDRVLTGSVLIAPGGRHLLLRRSGAQYRVEVKDGPLVTRHKPSANVLFRSVATAAGENAIGIIMTGMGDDGAIGLKELFDTGALTIGQNENSCVVYGMPKEAKKLGGVVGEVDLDLIPEIILTMPTRKQFINKY